MLTEKNENQLLLVDSINHHRKRVLKALCDAQNAAVALRLQELNPKAYADTMDSYYSELGYYNAASLDDIALAFDKDCTYPTWKLNCDLEAVEKRANGCIEAIWACLRGALLGQSQD